MPTSSTLLKPMLLAPILVVLSGCGSTTVRPDPPKDPFPSPPVPCLRAHPDGLSTLGTEFISLADLEKAREELRRKAEDGEQYRALWLDHKACREWLESQLRSE